MSELSSWFYNPTREYYTGCYPTIQSIPVGYYDAWVNDDGMPCVKLIKEREDEIFLFNNGAMPNLISEIQGFWNNEQRYRELGINYKRGIMLYGPPGCGKSGIINAVIKLTKEQSGVIIKLGAIHRFGQVAPLFSQIERGRKVIVICEDLENYMYDEVALLEILDGVSASSQNLIFLATTNKIDEIPKRIKYRPSRIDTLIEVPLPEFNLREEYAEYLCTKMNQKSVSTEIAAHTEGLSLADVKEVITSHFVFGKSIKEIADSLLQRDNDEEEDDSEEN